MLHRIGLTSALLASAMLVGCSQPTTPDPTGPGAATVPTARDGCFGTAEWSLAACAPGRVVSESNRGRWDSLRIDAEADREPGWLHYDAGFETYVLVSARRYRHALDVDLIEGVTGEDLAVWVDLTDIGVEVRRQSDERLLVFAGRLAPFTRSIRPESLDVGPLSFELVAACTVEPMRSFTCEIEEGPRNGARYALVATSDTGTVTIDPGGTEDVVVDGLTYRVSNLELYAEHRPSGDCGEYCRGPINPTFDMDISLVGE